MLATLLTLCWIVHPQPQDPVAPPSLTAVAVRGEAELTPAAAYASAYRRAQAQVQARWQERADRQLASLRPFWLPEAVARHALQQWLLALPADQLLACVDRQDREREHEFGSSWQTTLWVAEPAELLPQHERALVQTLRRTQRETALRYGGIAGGWTLVWLLVGWFDRLTRGYMTGRLRWIGALLTLSFPVLAFLV
jgi:hypothetical protein